MTANNNSQTPAPGFASSSPGQAEGLQRRLSARQLTMIAIGGAIGVDLFLGSSVTIELAGPGVIITYLLGAAVALVMAYALAEMAVTHPVAGSFGVYAEIYLSRWAGFTVRATYGLVQIIAIGAEVTAVAIYFSFWFPNVPAWSWGLIVSTALVTINALQVSNFGEFEYWCALIKVAAIIAFIGVGLSMITGLGPWPAVGLGNLTQHGGFLPHGWRGVWLALTLAITSYMGVEVIAVTAGEAQNPEESIPRAMRTIVATIPVGPLPRFLAAGEGGVWTLNQGDGSVSRIDPSSNAVVAVIAAQLEGSGGDIATGEGAVWVRAKKVLLSIIRPDTNRVVERFGPPAGSGAVRVAGKFTWVTAHDIQTVWVLPSHSGIKGNAGKSKAQ